MLILIFNQEIFLCTSSSKVNASHYRGGHLDLKNRTEKASSPARPALFAPLTEYNFRKAVCGHANLLGPLIITGGKENYQLFSNCTLVTSGPMGAVGRPVYPASTAEHTNARLINTKLV